MQIKYVVTIRLQHFMRGCQETMNDKTNQTIYLIYDYYKQCRYMSIKSKMKKARNISKKEILILLVIAVVLLVIYALSSGILKSSVPYFAYNGDVEPAESIHVRLVVFDKKDAMKKED